MCNVGKEAGLSFTETLDLDYDHFTALLYSYDAVRRATIEHGHDEEERRKNERK